MGSDKSQKNDSSPRRLAVASILALGLIPITLGVLWWPQPETRRGAQPATTTLSVPESASSTGSARGSRRPLSLRGVPLRPPTNLHLLVADSSAPFLLDVDRRTFEPITGLPSGGARGIGVAAIGTDALVSSYRFCRRCQPGDSTYLVRRGSTSATPIGRVMEAVSARDGDGVWTLSRRDGGRCRVKEVDLDGRRRGPARPVPCRTGLIAALPAGLLISSVGPLGRDAHSALLGPTGQAVRLGDPGAQPVVGNLVLTGSDRHAPLVLRDVATGSRHELSWPSTREYSLAEVTGDPNGRLAIVRFARFSPEHRLDMWLLDTQTLRWQHLPGMPSHLVPKATDVEWSADGRVVILSGDVLGVWRPGSAQLAVARVKRSTQPGSNFVVW